MKFALAMRRETLLLALADPLVSKKIDGARSIKEVAAILEDWCNKKNIQVKHIEAST